MKILFEIPNWEMSHCSCKPFATSGKELHSTSGVLPIVLIDCMMQSAVIQLWKSTLKKIELRKRSCGLFDFVTAVFILSQCHWFPEDVALYEANLPLRITVYVNRINELLVCDFAESSHPHSKNVLVIFISYTSYPQTVGASLLCE